MCISSRKPFPQILHTFFLPISYCVKLFVPLDMPHTLFSLSSKEEIYHLQFLPTKILSSASPRATPKLFSDRTVIHFWPLTPCGDSEVSVYKSLVFLFFIFSPFPYLLPPTYTLSFLSVSLFLFLFLLSFLPLSFFPFVNHKEMCHRLLINQKTHILLSWTHTWIIFFKLSAS